MTTFPEPEYPATPEEMTDRWCVEQIAEVSNYRRTRNLTFPRFVRSLNRAGFAITVEDYKKAEQTPARAIEPIRAGMLPYCYQVLNSSRVAGSQQHRFTEHAISVIAAERQVQEFDFQDMAEMLAEYDVKITPHGYRTCEQGITREVPFDVIYGAARVLGLSLEDVSSE